MGADLCGSLLVLGGDGVASLFLREVEGAVGTLHEGAEAILFAVPSRDTKAEGDSVEAVLKDLAQVLAECDHRLEVVVQGEQDELVAAVADEEVAAVDLLVDGVGDLLEDLIAREVSLRVVDGFEVIHVKDGERELESAFVGERGELGKAVAELMAVAASFSICSRMVWKMNGTAA